MSMFDYVSRKEYEAEHDRRVKAEALVEHLSELLKTEQERMTDLLERFYPKPNTQPLFTGEQNLQRMTSGQILAIPAIGKRGLAERDGWYREAVAREVREKEENTQQERTAALSPEERQEVAKIV